MSNTIYIANLSKDVNVDDLRRLCSPYGVVRRVQLPLDPNTNRMRGFAFVEMGTAEEALAAMSALNDTELQGRGLKVTQAPDKALKGDGRGGGGGYQSRY